ncbi:hypothetical protein DFH94DRAFT_803683 [Russula ochroleuca]|uniref:Fungal STAND N-terminal Goodbye domain-containing protein n=1 Tax=Russula ochroleuca TaxID=152965 RepID=A0A9P5MS01_9AGAM|nr:hypothetical protein DFH94DRAFT_803683 [Russula ochroleuca]
MSLKMSSGFTSHQGGCESAYLVTTTLAPLPLPQGPQTAHNTRPPPAVRPLSPIHYLLLGVLALSTQAMSQIRHSASSSSSKFQSVLNDALDVYEKKTKNKLLSHPLATQLQSCNSSSAILSVLEDIIQQFDRRRRSDERLTNWLNPTVNVLYAFSSALGQGPGSVFSPANVVFSGIGVLLLASKDVDASQDVLTDIFVRIECFFKRLETYTEVQPTAGMSDVIMKIMIEVLSILGIATKEIKQGRSKKFMKTLLGKNNIEDALKKLDTLTMEEARMAIAETLNVTHRGRQQSRQR